MILTKNKWISFLFGQLRDIIIAFLIGALITYFFMGNALFSSIGSFFRNSMFGFILTITIWKGNSIIGHFIESKFPWEKNPMLTLIVEILASLVYTAVTIIVVNVVLYDFFFNVSITENFRQYLTQMIIDMGVALLIITLFYVRSFFTFWRKAAVNEEKYKQEALQLQYETLKGYVNPHFLFNSLSVLSSLVEKDVPQSQLFIKQLSDIYRYVLEQKGKELVPLETELDFAKSFIDLHKIRHGENLRVEVQIEDKSGYTVPLSMQILLENAFKHNVISEEEPLEVKIWRDHDYIIVQNRIRKRNTIEPKAGTGLETITRQFEFLTSKSLLICDDDGFFTVHVPVLDLSELRRSN
ncbi:MAG: histidine kinase [Bacteroidales bacterium]|nr:histidine kinase [Bacteroidales bacterium]